VAMAQAQKCSSQSVGQRMRSKKAGPVTDAEPVSIPARVRVAAWCIGVGI